MTDSAALGWGADTADASWSPAGEAREAARALLAAVRAGEHAGPVPLAGAHLVGADLSGLDLTQADLTGANLSRADLTGAVLLGARMRDAVLHESKLTDAELTAADLTGANLEDTTGERVGLGGARLAGARLGGARLHHSTLTSADLTDALLTRADLRHSRLREATLAGADLVGADLREADLGGARLPGARLDEADLRGSSLTGVTGFEEASWIGADLRDINFSGAYLLRRFAMDQNFLHEFRGRGRAAEWVYRLWWVTSDCGRSMVRWSVMIVIQVLAFAGLYTLVGVDYGPNATALSPVYFSVVTITTLGFGDVLPTTTSGQCVTMLEVVTGYIMLGGLLSVFSGKMARRSE